MFAIIEAFVLHFLQGITFEFADDLLCWASDAWLSGNLHSCRASMVAWAKKSANIAPYAAFVGTLIGYAVSPLSVVVAAFMGKPHSPGDAFGRAFSIELVEGAIAVIGQLITDQSFGAAVWSFGLSAVIAPIRGSVAAFTFAWDASGAFKFLVLLVVLTAALVGLSMLGLLPI
ncbi:hypothetical protein [uncultured Tateyamaria sp.]|uniref:hypothetical protein n=1 Tax=uncultured Tateyamaria sp. TaxID=455651 RepID=UPI0026381D13|nr:hypothetical protein [uncultured Tateyamaria sp.]